MNWFEIETDFIPTLTAAGLDNFDVLADSPLGEPVSKDHEGREVRRLALDHNGEKKSFFLKRVGLEAPTASLRMLLYGKRPSCGAIREQMMLAALDAAGLPAMKAVAWGEERVLGMPLRGFLLVEAVAGSDVTALYPTANHQARHQVAHAVGQFMGKLHRNGFFQPVRMKDLFCVNAALDTVTPDDFVLIDRETSKPWRAPVLKTFCFRALARSYRRTLRDGFNFEPEEMVAFVHGYANAISARHTLTAHAILDYFKLSALKKLNPPV